LRAAPLSLSVTRDEVGLEEEFEAFMQCLGTEGNGLVCVCAGIERGSHRKHQT
jgi:hypothetical protein